MKISWLVSRQSWWSVWWWHGCVLSIGMCSRTSFNHPHKTKKISNASIKSYWQFMLVILPSRVPLHWSDLIKSAEVHGAPVDAAAQLADVDHVAVAGHAHLLHQLGAHRVTRAKLTRGGNRAQFARVLKLELKRREGVRNIYLSWYNEGIFCRGNIELLAGVAAGR